MGTSSSSKGRHGKKFWGLFSPGPSHERRALGIPCGAFLWGVIALLLLGIAPGTVPTIYNAATAWLREAVHQPLQHRKWDRVAAAARTMPRFACSEELEELHTHIVTVERLQDRSQSLQEALTAANVPFELVLGQDGVEDIPAPLMTHYASEHMKEMITGQGYRPSSREEYWTDLIKQKEDGTISKFLDTKLQARMSFAAKLSFLQLLHKMVSNGWKYMLILEDHAVLAESFVEKLQAAMCNLPSNWQVFHLNACNERKGGKVGDGVRQFIEGSCTTGTIYTLEFAIHILYERAPRSERRFDQLVMRPRYAEWAYIVDPPLVNIAESKAIPTDIENEASNPADATTHKAEVYN